MKESLENLIRRRQDELRGRPEDWIDRLCYWWRTFDLEGSIVHWALVLDLVLLFACVGAMLLGVCPVLSCR